MTALRRFLPPLFVLLALGHNAFAAAIDVVDDMGDTVHLDAPARRIVSLAPHLTELIYAAGAGERLVAAVEYSDYPPKAKALPRIGSYTNADLEAVVAQHPDLVVSWRSGNPPTQIERLRALGIPVYVNEPRDLDAVAHTLRQIGRLAGTGAVADAAADAFEARQAALRTRYASQAPVGVFYQIWDQPLMTINGQHLISAVIRLCGGRNVFADLDLLAPKIGVESVLVADPEVIVASGMGEARPEWLDAWRRWPQLTAVKRDNLFFIPPELIQRHTPRILDGATRLCEQLDTARRRRPAQ
ncbi:cobalamin-binding protein [Nitrogeniibacter mangrovi]|uniref:Cobalamin-binding protein n=1 Tax=Nitrogeniibacter mangrovi TaxID=2016596 RepID=A0A6C1BA90_9RHOO|nr:cobalamin-binding protein [Nitrogeniibacter mangrovi]QID19184.1 cobalamin-binding protein [Nitrogeniibacter mangrovi]